MIHLGDITKINGNEVPIVDCAIGGSPCQDLSQAGLRKGLAGDEIVAYADIGFTLTAHISDRKEGIVNEHRLDV